jgi:hypothetical protein
MICLCIGRSLKSRASHELDRMVVPRSRTHVGGNPLQEWEGVWCRVALVDVSKELSASFIRVTRIGELVTVTASYS